MINMIKKSFWAVSFLFLFIQSLQSAVNIIPTPKWVEEKKGKFWLLQGKEKATIVIDEKSTSKERLSADYINKILKKDYRLSGLNIKVPSELTSEEKNGNLILIGNLENNFLFKDYQQLLKEDEEFLQNQKSEQVYIINFFPNKVNPESGVVFLSGKKDQGTLYAAVSFTQLIRREKNDYFAQPVQIRDYPDFEYRWPGSAIKDVDEALRWKINLSPYYYIYDSFNPEKSGNLTTNRYARERGIKPVNGVLGNLTLKNRKSYPDGATYECIGEEDAENFTLGYCPSNEELLKLKCEMLKRFVERTEPGCLYIHFLDMDTYESTEIAWKNRCPECRKRWPSDVLEAIDGKAGAQSYVFNKFCEAIFSVKKGDGYDAKEDCLVLFVSAPYCRWSEPDSAWEKEIEYYVNVSKNMKYVSNVEFCMREEGPREDGKKMRVLELAEALKKRGKGHEVFLYFAGGDKRTTYRNWPVRHQIPFYWLASPVMSQSFEGANTILVTCATHLALKAEYMWNRKPVGGYWIAPENRGEWGGKYASLITPVLPTEIFSKGKFFDRVYQNIYGEKAGSYIAEGLRPITFQGGTISPEPSYTWLELIDKSWLFTDSPELQEKWLKLFAQIAEANRRAIDGINSALTCEDLIPGKQEELKDLLKKYEKGLYWAKFAQKEASFYLSWIKEGKEKAQSILTEINSLLKEAPEGEVEFASKMRERIAKASSQLETVKDESELFKVKLESLKKSAPEIQNKIKEELKVRENYNLKERIKPLEYIRIGVIGGYFSYLLKDKNLGYCKGLKRLTEEIMDYDVICYNTVEKLTPEEITLIRNFISSGGGFLTSGATPYYIVGIRDLTPIADWLGARSYGNYAGKLLPAFPSFFSQDLEGWIQEFESKKGSACLQLPLTGLPILTYEDKKNLIFLLANKYGSGRVIYSSYAELPEDLIYKILLWLGHNKI